MTEGLTICWACKHLRADSAVVDGWMVLTTVKNLVAITGYALNQ